MNGITRKIAAFQISAQKRQGSFYMMPLNVVFSDEYSGHEGYY
jgi:hypothetical protein